MSNWLPTPFSSILRKLIWGFHIRAIKEEKVDIDYRGGSLVRPPPFGVEFRVRSEVHAAVLEREAEEARVFMEGFEKFD